MIDSFSDLWSDMSSERKALLEKAYPEVRSFCCGLGLVFEVSSHVLCSLNLMCNCHS